MNKIVTEKGKYHHTNELWWFIVVMIGWLVIGSISTFEHYIEPWIGENLDVYEVIPGTLSVGYTSKGIVYSAEAKKLRDCRVRRAADLSISTKWVDDAGKVNVKAYDLVDVNGNEIKAGPIVKPGETFVVGPFLIVDTPDIISKTRYIRQSIPCYYTSGTRVEAQIGPFILGSDGWK